MRPKRFPLRTAHLSPAERRRRAGFTVVEVAVSATILVIGVLGMLAAVVASDRLTSGNREAQRAFEAARTALARMQAVPLDQIFATYNQNPSDDPAGAGLSVGANFDVTGLDCLVHDGDGHSGAISLPVVTIGAATVLSESSTDRALGMPRDLNGDGVISAGAFTGTLLVLPVRVRVQWRGASGDHSVEVRSLIVSRGGT